MYKITVLFFCLLFSMIFSSIAYAGNLYKCVGADEIANYTNKKIEGSSCTFVGATGPGEKWEKSSIYNEELQVWIHKKSKTTPSEIKVWVLYNYSASQYHDQLKKSYSSIKSLETYNCQDQTTKTFEMHYYSESNGAGDVVGGYTWKEPLSSNIIPDTIGDSVSSFVCNSKKVIK